jgi:hypothetical protein
MTNILDSLGVTVDSGKRSNFSLFYNWAEQQSVFTVKGTAQHEHVIARKETMSTSTIIDSRTEYITTQNQKDCVPTVHRKLGITTDCSIVLLATYVRVGAKPKSRADICGSANLSNHENSVSDETTGEAE